MTDIRKVAAAEAAAEQNRAKAEARWRECWWNTTFALAEPERKPDITAAYQDVQEVLGQHISYLRLRRATGIAFQHLKALELPPRLSMSWLEAHRGEVADESVADELRKTDTDGVSLRDYAAQFGQTFEPKPTPAQVIEAIRSDPEQYGRAIARHPDVAEPIVDAVEGHHVDTRGVTPPADWETAPAQVANNMAQRLGTDLATSALRAAAGALAEAILCKERFGIEHPDQEMEALGAIERYLAAYKAGGHVSDGDRDWLEAIGIKL